MEYDKPRIASTIVLGILLSIFLLVSILFAPITWSMIREATNSTAEGSESATGEVVGVFAIALVLSLGVALAIVAYAAVIIGSGICLIFTLKNRKSTLKPVRIISYVYDGLVGLLITFAILKIVLLAIGI